MKAGPLRDPLGQPESPPSVTITIGRLIAVLRGVLNWNQSMLARKSKVKRSLICEYENDTRTPDVSTLERLLAAMDFRWSALGHAEALLLTLSTERQGSAPRARVATMPTGNVLREGAREIGKAAARLAELASVLEREEAGRTESTVPADHPAAAALLWDRLRPLAPHRQQALVREDPAFWNRSLCMLLCSESEKLCASSHAGATRLATLALILAEIVDGREGRNTRLTAYASAHLGNALRVGNDHEAARKVFANTDELWTEGAKGDDLLDYAQVLSLKASFAIQERRFADAAGFLDRAAEVCRSPKRRAELLVKRAKAEEERGELEAAIAILRSIEVPSGEHHTLLCVRHNLADNLSKTGKFTEADALLPEVRRLAQEHGKEFDRVRLQWVEGRIAGGLGRTEEAIESLTRVRGKFVAENLDYDTALVSIELAAIYAKENRPAEVKTLARHMVPIFQAKRVHDEALKALTLFRQAAEQERATVELAMRLVTFLRLARHNPSLRFVVESDEKR